MALVRFLSILCLTGWLTIGLVSGCGGSEATTRQASAVVTGEGDPGSFPPMEGWYTGSTGQPADSGDLQNWISYASSVEFVDDVIQQTPPKTLADVGDDGIFMSVSMIRVPGSEPEPEQWPELVLPLDLATAEKSGLPGDGPSNASLYRLRGRVPQGYAVEVWVVFGGDPDDTQLSTAQDVLDKFELPEWS
jgi:hypothetical protein